MQKVYYRIDDRLIHGQVVTGWSRYYQLKQIFIIDDGVANDIVQQQIISLVAPSGIKVLIETVANGGQLITEAQEEGISTLVLVKNPNTLVKLVESDVSVTNVIIGGMQFKNGRKKVTKTVSVTMEEANDFYSLVEDNVTLTYQVIPTDKQQDFTQLLGILSPKEV